ncbi:MAG: hypothetical protein ACTSYA_11115 [Candidatus Kariarchaeaceae archaeon]
MDELVFFLMVTLVITRFVGVITFADFFYRTRRKSFLFLVSGWFFYCLAPLVNILANNNSEDWLFSFYGYFSALGSLIIAFAGIKYFVKVNTKTIVVSLLLVTLIPLTVFLITSSPDASSSTGDFIQSFFLIVVLALALKKHSHFEETAGNSFYWFVGIVSISFVNAAGYIFFYSDKTINYSFLFSDGISILTIIFFIHLEHNISIRKSAILKDRYSHDLGNIIQIILGEAEVITIFEDNHSEDELLIIKEKCIEAAEHIKNIRKL